jgi:hypothetical protein
MKETYAKTVLKILQEKNLILPGEEKEYSMYLAEIA